LPIEFSLEMLAEKPVILPLFTGYVARGLLLHLLRTVDPSVSASLHEPDRVKPYSVTPLWFRSKERFENGYVLDSSYPCRISFRFLNDNLGDIFLQYLYRNDSLLLYDVTFRIQSVNVRSESYSDLSKIEKPVSSITLRFLTPTYLSILGTDYHYMFPDPMKVFQNLMRLWNYFSNEKKFTLEDQEEYARWLHKNAGVSKYKLETTIVHMREKKATGFTGWIVYELNADDEWNKTTQTLARFAEYSNIGGNRTGGFGVTKMKRTTKKTE